MSGSGSSGRVWRAPSAKMFESLDEILHESPADGDDGPARVLSELMGELGLLSHNPEVAPRLQKVMKHNNLPWTDDAADAPRLVMAVFDAMAVAVDSGWRGVRSTAMQFTSGGIEHVLNYTSPETRIDAFPTRGLRSRADVPEFTEIL